MLGKTIFKTNTVQFIYNSIDLKLSVYALFKMVCPMIITSAIQFLSTAQYKSNTCTRTIALCLSLSCFLWGQDYSMKMIWLAFIRHELSWKCPAGWLINYSYYISFLLLTQYEFINDVKLGLLFLIRDKYPERSYAPIGKRYCQIKSGQAK